MCWSLISTLSFYLYQIIYFSFHQNSEISVCTFPQAPFPITSGSCCFCKFAGNCYALRNKKGKKKKKDNVKDWTLWTSSDQVSLS